MANNKPKNKKAKKQSQPRMKIRDAMDLVDDDMPDGAYWAMISEMSGVDYGELGAMLGHEDDEDLD